MKDATASFAVGGAASPRILRCAARLLSAGVIYAGIVTWSSVVAVPEAGHSLRESVMAWSTVIVGMLLVLVDEWLLVWLCQGQLGKLVFGLRIVSRDGEERLRASQVLLRSVPMVLMMVPWTDLDMLGLRSAADSWPTWWQAGAAVLLEPLMHLKLLGLVLMVTPCFTRPPHLGAADHLANTAVARHAPRVSRREASPTGPQGAGGTRCSGQETRADAASDAAVGGPPSGSASSAVWFEDRTMNPAQGQRS